jgi:translation initiation factor IF-2
VKEFSDKIGISLARIIGELMKNGIIVNINSQIDFDTCFLIAESFDITVKKIHSSDSSITDLMDGNIEALLANDDPADKTARPPIISVMGHVDHGKTSIHQGMKHLLSCVREVLDSRISSFWSLLLMKVSNLKQ